MSNRNIVTPTIHCFIITIIINILLCSAHFLREIYFITTTENKTKTTTNTENKTKKTSRHQLRALHLPQQVASRAFCKTSSCLAAGKQAFLQSNQIEEAFFSFADAVGAGGKVLGAVLGG